MTADPITAPNPRASFGTDLPSSAAHVMVFCGNAAGAKGTVSGLVSSSLDG